MSLEAEQLEHVKNKCIKCNSILEEYDVYILNNNPKKRIVKNYSFKKSFRTTQQGNICFKCNSET